jgi:hypothetical protein
MSTVAAALPALPSRGWRAPAVPAAQPTSPNSLIHKHYSRFSRFSRLLNHSNTTGGAIWVDIIKEFGLTPAEPAEPAAMHNSQWVSCSSLVAAGLLPCCASRAGRIGALIAMAEAIAKQPACDCRTLSRLPTATRSWRPPTPRTDQPGTKAPPG